MFGADVSSQRGPRVRAPRLTGAGGWINAGPDGTSLQALRGRIVLLDFWTFCCVNCLHVIDELRPLEDRYADVLTVIGVHSPKFEREREHAAVVAAVERYGVQHPVLDDPGLVTWQQYAARAWPTLCVVDPEGYLVATMTGEGHAAGLARLVDELVVEHDQRGTLRRGQPDLRAVAPPPPTPLRFPGKVLSLPGGGLLVSDTAQHRLVELAHAVRGEDVRRVIGSGRRGSTDGGPDRAEFSEPQGMALLPPSVAMEVGYDVVVADTANHLLRGLRLSDGHVRTVAGSGSPWRPRVAEGDLSSPWDVAWWGDVVVVAMAGIHQLWTFEPLRATVAVLAGTTTEGLSDGSYRDAWFAQPSGLAADGERLWLVDAETSALRYLQDGEVHTAIGEGLFDFGHRDGPAGQALLQHPLGLAILPDGSVAICDTYNDAVRRYDPRTAAVSTMATGLSEPSGAVLVGDELVVVESGAHRLIRLPADACAGVVGTGAAHRTPRPASVLAAGEVELTVRFEPAPGQRLDDRDGPATRLEVSATPPDLLLRGAGTTTSLTRRLRIAAASGDGVLHITAQAAACDHGVEHPTCHLARQDWGVPIRVGPDGEDRLDLVLRG